MEPELWDAGRTRLTVLLEPGRIKRGLAPQLDAGYPLVEGQDVTLQVAARFIDAAGRPLRGAAARRYRVGPDARERVDPSRWRLNAPAAQTRQPLTIRFDQPLDSALALRCITVVDGRGQPLRGRVALSDGEREWGFTPSVPWDCGQHAVRIDPVLEDLAGNSVRRVFDRDVSAPDQAGTPNAQPVELPFGCS
jgi:hypothetical protein